MAVTHTYRTQAVEHARAQGYTGFRTLYHPDQGWKATYQDKDLSPAHGWAQGKDYIHHTEVFWVDGRKVGVVVVTCTLAELVEDKKIGVWIGTDGYHRVSDFIIEPLTTDLWEPDPPMPAKGQDDPARHEKWREHRAASKAAKAVAAGGEPTPPRERSTADSPVKRVWAICDANPDKPRAEVVNLCVSEGINKSTAGTQYSHWKRARAA